MSCLRGEPLNRLTHAPILPMSMDWIKIMELSMEKNCAKLHTRPVIGGGMATAIPDRISAQWKFSATNLRFKADATLEVMTTFRRPNTLESQVLRAEGSKIIRERVFNKILEAENETNATKLIKQIDIVPANYSFSYL